jgi:glutamine amidotransferase
MQTIAIIDYGAGNLRSVARALAAAAPAARIVVVNTADDLAQADRLILPGQGAFADCMRGLSAATGMIATLNDLVLKRKVPFLGVCVGMQLLMTTGLEHGATAGLGWVGGVCAPLQTEARLPHMGWTGVKPTRAHPVLDALSPQRHMYFAHSFVAQPEAAHAIAALADHGGPFAAAIAQDNILGVQFHPEKSQAAGLDLLARFAVWTP